MKSTYLANQVKILRSEKGYSQEYLAEQTKLSLRTIQRIEGGQTEPHGDTLQRLAICLGVDVTDLLEQQTKLPDALPENKSYLILLHLSALSFLFFPLLGVVIPLVLWMLKRDQISGMAKIGKKVLNFQITWLIMIALYYGYIFCTFLNIRVPFLSSLGFNVEVSLLLIIALYLYNIILVVINAILEFNNKRLFTYRHLGFYVNGIVYGISYLNFFFDNSLPRNKYPGPAKRHPGKPV
ncbi:helix-turn-helix domain-containing protein [Mucilaginibacter sp. CSA2-8R]|uniref:helix-turn-helix domain-containing protein n=1 Tax=Mucilaginibacter sp. CSA2-8R TaxID=3141542 RepID=UPI00315C4D75